MAESPQFLQMTHSLKCRQQITSRILGHLSSIVISPQLVVCWYHDINFLFIICNVHCVGARLTARLQRPVKLFSEIPVHRFDRCIFVQGVTSKFAPWIIWQIISTSNAMVVNLLIPIPLCLLPPNGTLLHSKLYWFIQTVPASSAPETRIHWLASLLWSPEPRP